MNKTLLFFIGFLLFIIHSASCAETTNRADSVNTLLLHPTVDITKSALVSNLIMHRDQGIFELQNGKIYFAKPIYGNCVMALFLGIGSFCLTPPSTIEKEHVKRFYGIESIQKQFSVLFLVFTDSTFREIIQKVRITNDKIESDISDYFEVGARYLGDENTDFVDQHWGLMADILNSQKKGVFYSLMTNRSSNSLVNGNLTSWRDDPLIFINNPYDEEDVQLLRRLKGMGTGFYQETISRFHNKNYLGQSSYLRSEIKPRYNVDKYELRVKVDENLSTSISALMTINPNEKLEWLSFDLYYKLDVDSVFVNGHRNEFYRPRAHDKGFEKWTNSPLWIKTDSALQNMERTRINVFYHGEIIGREDDQVYLKASDDWYPSHNITRRQKHLFDISFEYPKTYKIISLGERTDAKVGKKSITERWVNSSPIRHCTFNIGLFKEFTFKDDRIPDVHIVHRYDRDVKTLKNQVMADIANSYVYYEQIFGKMSGMALFAAEHPFSHSEAYPGLVNLWWKVFQSAWESGDDELIRAHEIAHQWWGIGLDFDTYHDQWLSEAFAEYSAMMYVQQSMKNNDEFFRMLQESKVRIINNRNGFMDKLLGDDQQAGPIWLGYRTSSSTSKGDYGLIIYEKGMWVLHMIRNMLVDMNTMNEDKYRAMMKDFYQSFKGKNANTNDFKVICEKHFNSDMTWFFDQWVYGSEIPKYEFAYKTSRQENGKYKVRCQVKQLNVAESFRMIVPITLDFGDKRYARLRIVIQGHGAEFDLPTMPLEPKKVIFNDFESVLCEVENVNWKN